MLEGSRPMLVSSGDRVKLAPLSGPAMASMVGIAGAFVSLISAKTEYIQKNGSRIAHLHQGVIGFKLIYLIK